MGTSTAPHSTARSQVSSGVTKPVSASSEAGGPAPRGRRLVNRQMKIETRQNAPIGPGRSVAGSDGGIQGSAATSAVAKATPRPDAMPHNDEASTTAG